MASRRRRSLTVNPAPPRGRVFFRPKVVTSSSAGRPAWRSRLAQSLLRPVPLGSIVQEDWRGYPRPLVDLRARRARIASTSPQRRLLPRRRPVKFQQAVIPLGKPVWDSRSTPCMRREKRREVMFAQNVAGRKWGRGGPRMDGAKFSVDSQYVCRR